MKIRVGSRASQLAIVQAELVIAALKKAEPSLEIKLVTMKTTGDKLLNRPLEQVGGKGLFVKELDEALRNKQVDLTVHSLKDMPMEIPEDLPILAISKREDPRDVLILPSGECYSEEFFKDFIGKKPVGCSSLRRKLQLQQLYPGVEIEPIRGNLQTRLKKLDEGQYSGLILAYAGIKRLGLEKRISRVFETYEILPAAGQGLLAVQGRGDFDRKLLRFFHSPINSLVYEAERSFIKTLEGGCNLPSCAYANINQDTLYLKGMYVNQKKIEPVAFYKKELIGNVKDAKALGEQLAHELQALGGMYER